MKKQYLIMSWVLRALVSLGFLMASLGKVTNNPTTLKMFDNWGYPEGFHFFIGILELLLAILLLIPKTLKYSLVGIMIIMIGATVTHIIHDPILNILRPLIFMILVGGIYHINFRMGKK